MKVEIELNSKQIARILAIVAIGLVIGFVLGMSSGPSLTGYTSVVGTGGYLTTADLNREDIGTSIVLSRFCEGMGLKSSVYWQQDEQGNVYGLPICLQP